MRPAEVVGGEFLAGVVLRQHALQGGVLLLDGLHGGVDAAADVGLFGRGPQVVPTVAFGNPEDTRGRVVVAVFQTWLPK
ncbi:MAG: hypothetical protein V9E82_15925 [Candidatus Nanopelagicales bacterium]